MEPVKELFFLVIRSQTDKFNLCFVRCTKRKERKLVCVSSLTTSRPLNALTNKDPRPLPTQSKHRVVVKGLLKGAMY